MAVDEIGHLVVLIGIDEITKEKSYTMAEEPSMALLELLCEARMAASDVWSSRPLNY